MKFFERNNKPQPAQEQNEANENGGNEGRVLDMLNAEIAAGQVKNIPQLKEYMKNMQNALDQDDFDFNLNGAKQELRNTTVVAKLTEMQTKHAEQKAIAEAPTLELVRSEANEDEASTLVMPENIGRRGNEEDIPTEQIDRAA